MKLFIDTANIEEIKKAYELGVICGVTTNPSLMAKENMDTSTVIRSILDILIGKPISVEVNSLTENEMYEEALSLAEINPNVVIKIPISIDGLKVVKRLSKKDIRTNVTLIFNANQALLAARAGASYVSPFVGRLDDINANGIDVVASIREIFDIHNIACEIIAASIRSSEHVTSAALAGSDIATVPYKVIEQMVNHPLTKLGIDAFVKDYENSKNK